MKLPQITHLQAFVLSLLSESPTNWNSRHLMTKLQTKVGVEFTKPAFYQLMGRLKRDRLIYKVSRPLRIRGKTYRENWFNITGLGITALDEARRFYKKL